MAFPVLVLVAVHMWLVMIILMVLRVVLGPYTFFGVQTT
jgi:hypothetical protein